MHIYSFILVQLTVILFSLPQVALAQSEDVLSNPEAYSINPESLEQLRKGYGNSPVVQCPGIKTKYLELISTLDQIKDKIKSEACPQVEKDKVEKEVSSVGEILTGDKRKEFSRIVKQGLAKNGEISPKEAESVRSYIENLVTTTAVVTGLTNNSACFDDESQDLTLATLSAVINEASSALGAITGPMGTKISLGGKVAAGLIDSVAKIVLTRETYCKGLGAIGIGTCRYDAAAEQAYVSNLCSYYKLKFDIDEFTNPQIRLNELKELEQASNEQINLLSNQCRECRQIIQKFNSSIDVTEEMQILKSEVPITFIWESPNNTSEEEDFSTIRSVSKPLYEYSYEELVDVFNKEIRQASSQYNSPTATSSEPPFDTIRTLRTRAWAQYEYDRVWGIYEDDSDVALNKVGVEQQRIENFLFASEAPKYIKFAAKRAQDSAEEFMVLVYSNFIKLHWAESGAQLLPDPNRIYADFTRPVSLKFTHGNNLTVIVDIIHDLFRGDVEFTEELTNSLSDRELLRRKQRINSRLRNLRSTIQAKLRAVKRDYAVFRDYCRLFEFGNLRFEGSVGDACIVGHEKTLTPLKQMFEQLEDSALGEIVNGSQSGEPLVGSLLGDVNKLDPSYVRNWVTSLTAITAEQNEQVRKHGLSSLAPSQSRDNPSAAPTYESYEQFRGIR